MYKLLKNLKNYSVYVLISVVCVAVTAICDLLLPDYMSNIVNTGIIGKDIDFIWKTGFTMLMISGISMVAAIIGSWCSSMSGMGFGRTIREKIFKKTEYFSEKEFDKFGTPSLITRTTNDVTQVQMVVIMGLRMLINAPIMFVGGIIMAVRKEAGMSWIIAVVLPVIFLVMIIMMRVSIPLFKSMQKKLDRINLVLREKLSGIRVIRAFNKSDHADGRFEEASGDLADTSLKVGKIMSFMMPVMMFIMSFTTLLILWVGAYYITDATHIGNIMAFISYLMQIMMSFMMVSMMFIFIPRAQVSAARINEVLETEYSVTDPKNPVVLDLNNNAPLIEFRDVSFSYEGAASPVVKNISFTGNKGETIAIIGSTGSGKSTLINLIPRFYDVTGGQILLSGRDIRELSLDELRGSMGYIPQKAFLFDGTIEENVREGNENASHEDIMRALEISQASGFVSEMPEKENSHISQGATNVSGGQKQRLSIARALARRVPVYIFDDTFSALDFKTDSLLRGAIKRELSDSLVLIVAQRVGTIMHADRIIVLEDGEICGMGRHEELLKSCEVYKEIVDSQIREEDAV